MWSYAAHLIGSNKMMQVRRLIGDTDPTNQQFQDEEIQFFLSQRFSVYGAAADACRVLAAGFAIKQEQSTTIQQETFSGGNIIRAGDTMIQNTNTSGSSSGSGSSAGAGFMRMAALFDTLAVTRGSGMPYAGGISNADKDRQESNADRVNPQFILGMDDSFLPVAPIEATPRDVEGDDSP